MSLDSAAAGPAAEEAALVVVEASGSAVRSGRSDLSIYLSLSIHISDI